MAEACRAVGAVAHLTERRSGDASHMARSAGAVSENSQIVAAASTQALANTQTVASASEQLTAPIREISSQVNAARKVTLDAVKSSSQAEGTISALSDAVRKINNVAQLINAIANQLTLDATIEAARATEDITQQIAEVQARPIRR